MQWVAILITLPLYSYVVREMCNFSALETETIAARCAMLPRAFITTDGRQHLNHRVFSGWFRAIGGFRGKGAIDPKTPEVAIGLLN